MNTKNNPQDENKKRAAFKRFSQMSAAGLAVISFSAFTDLNAQSLQNQADSSAVKLQIDSLKSKQTNEVIVTDAENFRSSDSDTIQQGTRQDYVCEAYHEVHEPYVNNYSNSCD